MLLLNLEFKLNKMESDGIILSKPELNKGNYEIINKFIENNQNSFPNFDYLYMVNNKLIFSIFEFENLIFGYISHLSTENENFLTMSINNLNKLILQKLQTNYNDNLLKHLEKKIILFLPFNLSLNNYYTFGPISNSNVKSTFGFEIPYENLFYEYSLKINQYIYNNLPKHVQLQKQREKQANKELNKLVHKNSDHKKYNVNEGNNINKRQKF